MGAGNPPLVRERAERAKSTFQSFKQWLAEKRAENREEEVTQTNPGQLPTFREWLAEQKG
ncbi:hypothetical protein FRUB_03017 [Fimbriiglobus ruber]|uniref:Uncharacterized protein n=2 Tax=Fimbriiglobus ruber TaxID=1908690 RepID=A0A225DY05_9BACT|nr:hypothetical protein FRUB_03017 [Fimbriiglobus ruber]